MGIMKGQGATEYLVLLGAVLIVALVALALLGFFPGLSSDAKIQQSQAYWTGEAQPFGIIDYGIVGTTGNATLVLQNKGASAITLTSLQVGNGTVTPNVAVGPGSTFRTSLLTNTGTPPNVYDLAVVIDYNTSNGIAGTQAGAKTLTGKYT